MNYDNLKLIIEVTEDYSISDGEPPLFCDGHLIALAGPLPKREWIYTGFSNKKRPISIADRALDLFRKSKTSKTGEFLAKGEIFGDFHNGYRRRLSGTNFDVFVDERFIRCFDDDSTFCGSGAENAVLIYERDGGLAGVVMPIRIISPPVEEWPEVPYVANDVLYHNCDLECSHANGF